jgi:2-polyprenyl-3-methyl-5-hydroxy-6-metoxy-1,4-benzoquinol methylase
MGYHFSLYLKTGGDTMSTGEMSSREIADMARRLYVEGPVLLRSLQHWRPYICPFGALAELVPPGGRVLDVGCGGGLFLGILALSRRIAGGVGFDSNGQAIAQAQAMTRQLPANHGVVFEHLSVSDAWPSGTFDAVSLIDVMHHVPLAHQAAVFAAAASRVAPGGVLIYKDIAPTPHWRAFANRLHDLLLARQWIHYAAAGGIEGWGREQGMTLEFRRRIDMLWYGHDLAVFRRPA